MSAKTVEEQTSAWRQFQADLLSSKFKGTHTEAQLLERLTALTQEKNMLALRAMAEAKRSFAPDGRMKNSIWEKGAIYRMSSVEVPEQTGPAGTDNFGLWRRSR